MKEEDDLARALGELGGPQVPSALVARIIRDVPQLPQEKAEIPAAQPPLPANDTAPPRARQSVLGIAAAAVLVLAGIGGIAMNTFRIGQSPGNPANAPTIAVAPSPDPRPLQSDNAASPDFPKVAAPPRLASRTGSPRPVLAAPTGAQAADGNASQPAPAVPAGSLPATGPSDSSTGLAVVTPESSPPAPIALPDDDDTGGYDLPAVPDSPKAQGFGFQSSPGDGTPAFQQRPGRH